MVSPRVWTASFAALSFTILLILSFSFYNSFYSTTWNSNHNQGFTKGDWNFRGNFERKSTLVRSDQPCPSPPPEHSLLVENLNQIRKQRDDLSARLDIALQKQGQLECEKVAEGEVAKTGGWCQKFSKANSGQHATDQPLLKALAKFFQDQTVASFGDGPGEYKRGIDALKIVKQYDAYDGAPWVELVTNGTVKHLDLSVERFGLPIYDWILSLEVAEHIPAEFESAFLSNIVRHARKGVVLSWAVPGQGGFHHVNLRAFEYVEQRFLDLDFVHDPLSSNNLREHSTLPWLKSNVNVFRRKQNSVAQEYLA